MMRVGANPKRSPQFRLLSATREHEVGITSNRGSARHGEFVPGPCTPRPSRSGSRVDWKTYYLVSYYFIYASFLDLLARAFFESKKERIKFLGF